MAEQTSHDVVDQTLSGGDPTPSDVPASTNDKIFAGGDVGENEHTITSTQSETKSNTQHNDWKTDASDSLLERNETGRGTEKPSTVSFAGVDNLVPMLNRVQDIYKQGPGPVASRALELNGMASTSDAGDDTASQGGSESDASRADSRSQTRAGSTKKPTTFKPVSFAKFSVPKAPGTPVASKSPDKGIWSLSLFYKSKPDFSSVSALCYTLGCTSANVTPSLGCQNNQ